MKINIFGDFVPIERGVASVLDGTAIDAVILSRISGADFNIVNLECPVVSNCGAKGILKDGPCLKTSEDSVRYLKTCGFDMVTLANNHLNDYGSEGVHDTFAACEKNGIMWVGAGENLQEARSPKIVEGEGLKIGIINVCENESSIATGKEPGSNPIGEIDNYYDICQLKNKVDGIIIIIHGGSELYRYPTPRMKKLCHFYADIGASAIVCHHPHCYSGYEVYNGVPIFYSLGNFFFDSSRIKTDIWSTGYFVQLSFKKESVDFQLFPYIQCKENATVALMDEKRRLLFEQDIEEINNVIRDDDLLEIHYGKWLNKRHKDYISRIMPWNNKYFSAAYRRNLVPAWISKKYAMLLLNFIRCESHRDLMKLSLKKFVDER